jgi:ribosome recycling factor
MLDDILKTAEHKMTTAVEILGRDLQSVRTGRASPALLDRIQVDYYGTPTPVNGVANVSAPDPRMVLVQPWDPKMLGVIEKAIKQVHQRAEEARVAVRNCRRDALEHLRKAEKEDDSGISMEDEKRAQERLQKLTDQFVKRIEEVSRRKETEVTEV